MTDATFWFDFASPNAFLVHRVIPTIEARTGARFDYVPVLLGGLFKLTGNQAPMMAFAGIPAKLSYERVEMQRFIARHQISEFTMNPHFPVNTLTLMRGAIAAQAVGVFTAYVEAMFHYMWVAPRKLDDLAVFAATMTEAGLPAEALIARAQHPEIKAMLATNTQAACDKGAFGIPSFLVSEQLWFGKDRLPDVEQAMRC